MSEKEAAKLTIRIRHKYTKEVRELDVIAAYGNKLSVWWPQAGDYSIPLEEHRKGQIVGMPSWECNLDEARQVYTAFRKNKGITS